FPLAAMGRSPLSDGAPATRPCSIAIGGMALDVGPWEPNLTAKTPRTPREQEKRGLGRTSQQKNRHSYGSPPGVDELFSEAEGPRRPFGGDQHLVRRGLLREHRSQRRPLLESGTPMASPEEPSLRADAPHFVGPHRQETSYAYLARSGS